MDKYTDGICAVVMKKKLLFSFDTRLAEHVQNYMAYEGYLLDPNSKRYYYLEFKNDLPDETETYEIRKVKVKPKSFQTTMARGEYKLK